MPASPIYLLAHPPYVVYNCSYAPLREQEVSDVSYQSDPAGAQTRPRQVAQCPDTADDSLIGQAAVAIPRPADTVPFPEFEDAVDGLTAQDYRNFALVREYEIARSSRRSYNYQWNSWREWADDRRVESLPANPLHVKAYIIERMLTHGHKPATLRAAAAAISHIHRENRLDDPCANYEVRATLSAAGRMMKWKQKQAPPLTEEVFWKIIPVACIPRVGRGGSLERSETALVRGHADIAIIGLMRDCLLRVGEASEAVWSDLVRDPDGSGTLWIPKSKTDQKGEGEVGYIAAATMTFLETMRGPDVAPGDRITGLRPNQISRRIKRAALAAGLGKKFSGHSTRVGMAQDLADSGTSLTRLMNAGRWKSPSMPSHYTRRQAAQRNAVAQYYNPGIDGGPEL